MISSFTNLFAHHDIPWYIYGFFSNGNDSHHRKRKKENHVTTGFPVNQDTSVSRLPHLDVSLGISLGMVLDLIIKWLFVLAV